MRDAKGKVMVSINDVPQVREIFSGFHFIEVSTIYTLGDNQKKAAELVICNFVPEEKQKRLF